MAKIILVVFLVFSLVAYASSNRYEHLKALQNGLQEYQATRIKPSYLQDTIKQFQLPRFFRNSRDDYDILTTPINLDDGVICELCYVVSNFLLAERRLGLSKEAIAFEAIEFCTLFGIENQNVCKGVIDRNIDIFAYLADTKPELKGERICDIIMQKNGCNATTFEWTVDIPEGQSVPRNPSTNPESTFNILQISDFHYDPLYTPNKVKDCGEPVCCQVDQEDGNIENGTACGYWSEYISTDASTALVDESLRKSKEFDFDYVYFTGDIISHRVWATSVENNTRDMKTIFRKLKRAFPKTPIYPILGNHEPTPLNEYAIGNETDMKFYNVSTQWLYRLVSREFSQWLPKDAKRTIMQGGFYTVSPRKGFRIIALNSNVAYTMNWWLINDDVDPFGQLAFLAKTLKEAEENNEIVHILSHIPSGKADLLQVWSREYKRVINRFANTISGQFNGHTHHDQFMVYYNTTNTSQVINVAINGASVICDKSNPSFRLFSVNNENYDVIDSEEWTFNLTEANQNADQTPNWYKLYSFRDAYNVSSLRPEEFEGLLPRMARNHSILQDYHIYRYRNSDVAIQSGCDDDCKKNYLCEIAVSEVGDSTQCDWLKEIYDQYL